MRCIELYGRRVIPLTRDMLAQSRPQIYSRSPATQV